jgi:multiple sugar transport system permease protein
MGRASAILVVLWLITYILSNVFMKNWLRLRERARGRA